ncbi:EF hand [Vibrio aerogenes CECT 7868]|uniref:EF hand n=1 Tax=Vibrio aerogenes CECT 7868 TaxID=1216006 RepID=A0A1M5VTG6_9VIBR|nr:hypothetical protein [Vibrio aerogenes]SHH78480.1 EF hand [Vibrio aerogenes CECT 7868]
MKSNIRFTLTIFMALLIFPALSFASDSSRREPPGPPPSFADSDLNHDGVLTEDEVRGPLAEDFDQIDTDGDSQLTEEEIDAFMQSHKPPEPR